MKRTRTTMAGAGAFGVVAIGGEAALLAAGTPQPVAVLVAALVGMAAGVGVQGQQSRRRAQRQAAARAAEEDSGPE
jgi:hypothetical protein